ncbi:hypothetical protein [Geobacter sulfurreducens]|uniref:hypothetical protein n=1 Tax=Geobacter sulfurreducens TaxID=35554 RepID=UPI0020B8092C|nr:hypothetical protein [Geobacter sulfurreducens]UTG94178.1 hypothetical protein J8622_07660 [Geobacter sulfurreducens]
MKKQPDFTQLFYEFFGSKPRKVEYEVRNGPCRYHDLVFLSSLIHDARLQREKIQKRGTRVTIPINRDCWELGLTPSEENGLKYSELHIADAILSVSPVKNIEWSFNDNINFSLEAELWIQSIWLERKNWRDEQMNVVLDGMDWRCILTVAEDDLLLKVKDKEIPYLYSVRHGVRAE